MRALIVLLVGLLIPAVAVASDAPYLDVAHAVEVHAASGTTLPLSDAGWRTADWEKLEFRGVIWMRAVVDVPTGFNRRDHPAGLFLTAEAASSVWWDGRLLGHNGRPAATPEREVPGRLQAVFLVPPAALQPGRHVLLMRLSRQHGSYKVTTPIDALYLGPWASPLAGAVAYYLPGFVSGGAVALACLFLFVTGWRGRDDAALWLSAACFALLLQLGFEALRAFVNYAYPWQGARLFAIAASAWLFGYCLLGFLMERLHTLHPTRWRVVLGVLGLLACALPGDVATVTVLLIFLGGGLVLATWSESRHRPVAPWLHIALVLLVALLFLRTATFLDRWLYVGFALVLLWFFADHLRVHFMALHERDAARSTAARLELDLLKQHLKPHFLLNTLTALAEWVEESPRTAVRMIDTLADEFRTLIDVSDKPFIPLEQELALCRTHLEVMSYRHDRTFSLDVDRDAGNPPVPPMVLHTLVENGVTHSTAGDANAVFRFSGRRDTNGAWRLRLDCPAGETAPDAAAEGTGLAYVRARLIEAYGDDWQLRQGVSEGGGWFTEIVIPGGAACA